MVAKNLNLLAIVGPTASGKTELSIKLAQKCQGEVIAADSRTIYKYLDIGTAKPTTSEIMNIQHWGLDLVGPKESFTVADYKKYAMEIIKNIRTRGKTPIIVGGSGLYVDSVLYNFNFAPANNRLREKLELKTVDELQAIIGNQQLVMPENKLNKRYLIRAIERGKTKLNREPLLEGAIIIGICPPKSELDKRIVQRLDAMLQAGVLKEIEKVSKLYGWESEAMTGGIYRVFRDYLDNKITLEEAKINFIKSDQKLVKKQLTWFKRNPDIIWFDAINYAEDWFNQTFSGKLK
jgi:tRNA dimethylallyltransferase